MPENLSYRLSKGRGQAASRLILKIRRDLKPRGLGPLKGRYIGAYRGYIGVYEV